MTQKKMYEAIKKLLDVADAIKVSLSKQGLQWNGKEIVNIKPKFKVGDWIVGANNVFKIIALNNKLNCYIAITQNNEKAAKIPYYFDDGQGHMCSYHLWTIQDAKDGDILVSGKEKRPFIFKGLLDELHPNNPVAYCGIDYGDRFIVTAGTSWWTDKEIEPATKEQYDLLFSKMKEADYEWDVEQKTNSQRVTSAKAKEALLLDDELTEFEKAVNNLLWRNTERPSKFQSKPIEFTKNEASELLSIARKQVIDEGESWLRCQIMSKYKDSILQYLRDDRAAFILDDFRKALEKG